MKRPENDKWLDEALSETIGSKKSRTAFEEWKQKHPEAVEMLTSRAGREASASPDPLKIRRIIMTSTITKLAAAAVVVIAAAVGIHQLTGSDKSDIGVGGLTPTLVAGPKTIRLADGSEVKLAQGAQIQVYQTVDKRGFEHLAGLIDVSVTKGQGEFVITTPYGNVTALGTKFTMNQVDGIPENSTERVQLLAVEVQEGSVQVSNTIGSKILREYQRLTVEKDQAPYDFSQDESLPPRLIERIQAMVEAMEPGDAAAWMANYNINYMYKLVKGNAQYDANRFGGTEADLERIRKGFADVQSPEELVERFLASGGIKASGKIYVRSVELNEAGDHAQAECVERKSENHIVIMHPEWHYFDNDWWQVDD